jgi:outer membrane receptor protein involved in Fe transport
MATRSTKRIGASAELASRSRVHVASVVRFRWLRGALRPGAFGLPVLFSAAFMAQVASGAEATDAGSATSSPAERRQIEEVVVTAERKEASISDTSISITAFTGQMLEDMGIRNQEDLQNMIPAAVIQPYDMAIRGIGRNFRNLGGDPGIATYLNGVYSEDFGIASTEGGLFDIERIEVLRGPQGTLYGRNAIGGAVNFISKKPTDDFQGEARVISGSDGLQEEYGVLSGPIAPGVLDARLTGSKRVRDGYVDDLSGNQNPDNYGDENYALSLLFTPNDDITWLVRGNDRSYRRRMGGADAAGIVNFADSGHLNDVTGLPEPNVRDTSTYIFGYRGVDPSVPCADMFTRTAPVASPGVRGGLGCAIAGQPTFQFSNPQTGATVFAQRLTPGVDGATNGVGTNGLSANNLPNFAYGANNALQKMIGFDNLSGGQLKTDTNGLQNEGFDQHAGTSEMTWKVNDKVTMKYIFGYSSFYYDRNTDTDLTSSKILDQQFFVSQQAHFTSHELQNFFDATDNLSLTSGLFYYTGSITQRGNFYDSLCKLNQPCGERYANPAFGTAANPIPYAAINPGLGFMDTLPQMQLLSAKYFQQRFLAGAPATPGLNAGFNCLPGLFGTPTSAYCFGSWQGSVNNHVVHQNPFVSASNFQYQTHTERTSYAAYTQGVYTFSPKWALTLGARWARDMLDGEENDWYYNEDAIVPLGFAATGGASSLAAINQALGYLAADGTILNPQRLLVAGVPNSTDLWRALNRKDDDITWRANLDFTPSDNNLIYLSATKGSRAGGFNLVFFSANASYKTESLISYELGYKGTLRDGTMQVNSAVYYYDYKNVETFGTGPSLFNPNSTSTNVFSVPSAAIIGWDTDIDWLITDHMTLGANFSYTHSEYTDHFNIDDPNNPARPQSLFSPLATPIDLNGKQMLQVPEMKGGVYAQYTLPLSGDRGQLTGLVNWSWIDKVYFSAFESNLDAAPSYQRTDLRLTWNSPSNAWLIAGFVNNIFDDIGIRQVDHYGSTEAVDFIRQGATTDPRTMGIEVDYKFGAIK